WKEIPQRGKLLTYTIIEVAPAQFQSMAPYAVGIVQLEDGVRIPGMIRGVALEQIKIGMELAFDFGTCTATQQWPQWPRYYFKPA
ncbi:OB-fold domain-containing protein, partial [Candidatus Bathyarchaeota archaeon]|nr:OB-fold domain-containing protein [Candidatus Bathyarchaeota archaeon]